MLPSELLKKEISRKYNVNLEQYSWTEDFKQQIFSIDLDEFLEPNANTLGEIYSYGFNIGHCGLTSRYVVRAFDDARLFYGKSSLLVDTKNAPNGEHAWVVLNDFVIDTTLMICVPIDKAKELGYVQEKEIAPYSARMLSEYDVYDLEFNALENDKKIKKLSKIGMLSLYFLCKCFM